MQLSPFPSARLESPSSSGSRNLVSIKVQPVIQAFKECSKWQESLGGQFVFSWGAVFVAFRFPQGNRGNQLQLVEDYESYWPLTPAVEVTGGFQKRATVAKEYNFTSCCLPFNCAAIHAMNWTHRLLLPPHRNKRGISLEALKGRVLATARKRLTHN